MIADCILKRTPSIQSMQLSRVRFDQAYGIYGMKTATLLANLECKLNLYHSVGG